MGTENFREKLVAEGILDHLEPFWGLEFQRRAGGRGDPGSSIESLFGGLEFQRRAGGRGDPGASREPFWGLRISEKS